jgi:hypothetical protein
VIKPIYISSIICDDRCGNRGYNNFDTYNAIDLSN